MGFTTQTIKSKYLDADFEVSCWEMKQKGGKVLTIVEHAAIEDIVFNKIEKDGFTYELEPIVGIAKHPVFKCTMGDYMRKIVAIGEAEPSTLVNAISRQNPAIMASNRAFDRAAIRYLNLEGEGKVYSSEEITEECAVEDAELVSATEDLQNEETLFGEAYDESETQDESATPENPTPTHENDAPQDPGTVLVTFGKYRDDNKCVAEICATDPVWVDYVINKMKTDNAGGVTKRQIQAIRDYWRENNN